MVRESFVPIEENRRKKKEREKGRDREAGGEGRKERKIQHA